MPRKKREMDGNKKDEGRNSGRLRGKKGLYMFIALLTVALIVSGGWLLSQRQPAESMLLSEITADIVPRAGARTAYDIPLSLDNTQQFIDYYDSGRLTPEQESMVQDALLPLAAPCCDDNSMATCCCPCNLAKAVWGLSGYLVAEKNYDVGQVGESALQWLRFIRGDYYVAQELRKKGKDPTEFGLPREDSCYADACDLSFADAGCGGMGQLKL